MSTTIHTIQRPPRQTSSAPAPLLVLLHGYGASEHDLFDLADYLDPRLHVIAARGVLALPWGGYAWYHLGGAPGRLIPDPHTRAQSIDVLTKFVGSLPDRLGTDPQRTYLLGFSQGAIMSLGLAMRIPEQLGGIMAVSGYLDPELSPAEPPAGLSDLPIFQLHGTDDEVIPVEAGRRSAAILQPGPANYHYREYPIGHGIHPDGLRDMATWLRERLDEAPGIGSEE
ncbi:MAG: phospholipase [Oscillochloris sp.]|nr:phospholipase [Oscillochloris sp.]